MACRPCREQGHSHPPDHQLDPACDCCAVHGPDVYEPASDNGGQGA